MRSWLLLAAACFLVGSFLLGTAVTGEAISQSCCSGPSCSEGSLCVQPSPAPAQTVDPLLGGALVVTGFLIVRFRH